MNASLIVENVIQIKSGIMINAGVRVKNYQTCYENYSWNPTTCICENGKYLRSIADDLVITCDETINATDSVSTNVTSNVSTNFCKITCYILHTVFLVVILVLRIVVVC